MTKFLNNIFVFVFVRCLTRFSALAGSVLPGSPQNKPKQAPDVVKTMLIINTRMTMQAIAQATKYSKTG